MTVKKITTIKGARNQSEILKTIFAEHLIPFALFRLDGEFYLRIDGRYVSPEPIVYDFGREVKRVPHEFICWGMIRMDHGDNLL